MVAVRLVKIAARSIVNLTSPRCDIQIVQHWIGKRDWHDPFYEPLRDLMEKIYVESFDAENGHYRRLEQSIAANGVRNPVMLVSGRLQHRQLRELPPQWRGRKDALISEYLGGSRITIAAKHDLEIPAIVNDFGEMFPQAQRLSSVDEIAGCFDQRPRTITLTPSDGTYVNDMIYTHMPEGYSLSAQIPIRAKVVRKVKEAVADWLADNDRT